MYRQPSHTTCATCMNERKTNVRSMSSQTKLAQCVNVSTIEHLVCRLRDTGRVADRPRQGRPPVTTPRQDRAVRLAHLRNRHIHPKTVRNRLREFSLRAHRPYIGFPLIHACRARRISSGLMLWLVRKSWQTLATWVQTLSCCKNRWCCCTNGTATGRRISSLYLTPVKLPATPATLDQLRAALLEEWDNIPMRRINALMNSMHRRIRAVIDARGGHTRYWQVNRFHFNILGGYC
jgi:hypothetical protein